MFNIARFMLVCIFIMIVKEHFCFTPYTTIFSDA